MQIWQPADLLFLLANAPYLTPLFSSPLHVVILPAWMRAHQWCVVVPSPSSSQRVDSFDRDAYRSTQWTWPITAWCLPSAALYGDARVLVSLGPSGGNPQGRNFTAAQLPELFEAVGGDCSATLGPVWGRVANLTDNLTDPHAPVNVPVWCLYGTAVATPVAYAFPGGAVVDADVEVSEWASGDGQQDDVTNAACAHWAAAESASAEQQQQQPERAKMEKKPRWGGGDHDGDGDDDDDGIQVFPVSVESFPGADHDSLLSDPRLLEYLLAGPLTPIDAEIS
jgi:hypothetical protein